jgi:hypothetical protein
MREHLPEGRLDWSTRAGKGLNEDERRLVAAHVRANESLDIDGLSALLREDLRFAMPPQPGVSGLVGTRPSRAGLTAASAGATPPTRSAEQRWPTASMQWRCTCDVPGLPRTRLSRWTCCASRTEIITFDSEVFDWFGLPRQLEAS